MVVKNIHTWDCGGSDGRIVLVVITRKLILVRVQIFAGIDFANFLAIHEN